jgi:hypothetical protein
MPRLAVALVLVVALLAVPTGAQAGFAPTNDEVATAPNMFPSGLGIDAQGNSLFAWEQEAAGYEVKARRLGADGTLGPILDLDPGLPAREPVVAMAASGRAFVAWRAPEPGVSLSTGVRGRWIEADGTMGPILTLVVGKAGEVQAAGMLAVADPAGIATVAWKNEIGGLNGGKLMLRRIQPDGTLSPLVPDALGTRPNEPRITALPDGSTLIVYRSAYIEKAVVGPALELGAPQPISAENIGALQTLATDSQGYTLAAWRRDTESTFGIRGRLLDPAGNSIGGELMIEANFPENLDLRPLVADSVGDYLISWWKPDADEDRLVYARSFNRLTGVLGPTEIVSDPDLNAIESAATIDDFGTGAVAWHEPMGMSGNVPYGRTINTFGAPVGPIQQLFSPRARVDRAVSAPAAGVGVFSLETRSEDGSRSILARRHLVPPSCANSTGTVVQGAPTDVQLVCAGPAIEGATVVEAPKSGVLGAFKAGPALEYVPRPGFEGVDSFAYTAFNDGGASNVARVEIRVGKDSVKPVIERLRVVRSPRKRKATASAKAGGRGRSGFDFILRISEPAVATVTVERAARGVRKGKRCVKPGRGAKGKRCTRRVRIGKVGARTAAVSLRIPAPPKLAKALGRGGRFFATAVATDLAGNRSKPKSTAQRIKAKKKRR